MKISRTARLEVKEWMDLVAHEAADVAAEKAEIDRLGYETPDSDFAQENQYIRDEIDRQARTEYWNADQWRRAMQATYRFSDEEIASEYQQRLDDDQDYTDALYELHGYGHLIV